MPYRVWRGRGSEVVRFLKRLFAPRQQWVRTDVECKENRTVMIVTPLSGEHNTLRVLSIVEGWRLLIAPTLAVALELRQREDIGVILYDQDLPGVKWHEGVVALLKNLPPTCLILLSSVIQERARISLLATGGYDVTRKPVESKTLVRLVKGALALRNEIEFSRITHDEVTEL